MKSFPRMLGCIAAAVLVFSFPAMAKQGYGTLSGVVLDPSGTPQMGASIRLISEDAGGGLVTQLLSNQHGTFFMDRVRPGKYSVSVSVAGFLPATEHHVAVVSNLTTLLRVEVESLFSSLDTLRRKPAASAEPDDWKWVLRSSTATRAILQWDDDGDPVISDAAWSRELPQSPRPRALVQVSNGSLASDSYFPDLPGTAISYDQELGRLGHVLLAGQMSYQRGTSGSFASVWLPTGDVERGPETTFVWRQSRFGTNGMSFQAMRLEHTERMTLSDSLSLTAGAEYVRAGIVSSASTLRPHAQLTVSMGGGWTGSVIVASNPPSPAETGGNRDLESTIDDLDSIPPVLFRNGNAVLEGGWHEELAAKRKAGRNSSVELAAFHDSASHQAVFGNGPAVTPEFVQDAVSSAFLYDGGSTDSWGARAAYVQKLSQDLQIAAVYAWAGALSPDGPLNTAASPLRDQFATAYHQSVGARISGKIARSGTQFTASYNWVSGTALTRVDPFGQAMYQMDPDLGLAIRQPLPGCNGRWEALADFSNLLGQGYVNVNGADSRIALVPILRSFRGGVSFQF